ncbi:MAG: PorV/PorQ family protein [Ignavibacteriales bacterium]|nr:PorV/PorQ family protein [Ignavibacteriales bacterium]
MYMRIINLISKRIKVAILITAAFSFLTISQNIIAQEVDYSGTSAANFLKIGVGARPMAMGDAAISTVTDPTAMYWNVAALTRVEDDFSVAISSMDWLVETRNSYISSALRVEGLGSFGIDIQYLDYGKVEETTVYDQNGTGRFLSANDFSFGLGYARKLTDRFSFGVKVKYIQETIANASASGVGFDVGAVFNTTFFDNNLWLAASLANFGSKMKFDGRDLAVTYSVPGSPSGKQIPADLTTIEWEIPLLFRFGISNYFVKNEDLSVLVSYDVLDSRDYDVRHNLGTEVGIMNSFYLRGGYKINYDEVTYTIGAGLDFKNILDYNIQLDYLYLDYGVFSSLNQFTIRMGL